MQARVDVWPDHVSDGRRHLEMMEQADVGEVEIFETSRQGLHFVLGGQYRFRNPPPFVPVFLPYAVDLQTALETVKLVK